MDVHTKKIKVVNYRPDLVTVKDLEKGTTIKVNTKLFERQVTIGAYDVINPEMLPRVF